MNPQSLIILICTILFSNNLNAERTGVVASDRAAFSLDGVVVLSSELSRFTRQLEKIRCIDPQALLLAPLAGEQKKTIGQRKWVERLLLIYKLKKFTLDREFQSKLTLPKIPSDRASCLVRSSHNRRFLREFDQLRRANLFLESRFQDKASALDFFATISKKIKHYIYH